MPTKPKKKVQKEKQPQPQFTKSLKIEIGNALSHIEKFSAKEIAKLKKENPFTITKTKDGFDLGFYKIVKQGDIFVVTTNTHETLASFVIASHAVLYCALLIKKIFNLADDLDKIHAEYILHQSDCLIHQWKLATIAEKKTKSNDDWWYYDLQQMKLSQSKSKFEAAKAQMNEFTKYNSLLKKLKTTFSLD